MVLMEIASLNNYTTLNSDNADFSSNKKTLYNYDGFEVSRNIVKGTYVD